MKIARFLIALAVAVMGVASVQAQTAAEVKASVAKMSAAKAPCNQGPESFKSFIEKFNTDQAFIDERLAVTPEQKEKFASRKINLAQHARGHLNSPPDCFYCFAIALFESLYCKKITGIPAGYLLFLAQRTKLNPSELTLC